MRNFLGEKYVRRVKLPEGVKASISTKQKDEIIIDGSDIEKVSLAGTRFALYSDQQASEFRPLSQVCCFSMRRCLSEEYACTSEEHACTCEEHALVKSMGKRDACVRTCSSLNPQ